MFKRIISIFLIALHLVSFGPVRDALAFSAQSSSYKLTSGALTQNAKGSDARYTKLLLHADGADGSSTFKDEAGKTPTAQGKGSSALFDGNGDYLSVPDSDDWSFGSDDFTIDCWVRFNNFSVGIVSQFVDLDNRMLFYIESSVFKFEHWQGGVPVIKTALTSNFTPGVWYHLAVVRSGNDLKQYVNGIQVGTTIDVTGINLSNLAAALEIGRNGQGGGGAYLNGWIDEVRVSKGIARWTTNFTPSASAYTPDNYTKLLLHADGANGSTTFTDDIGHSVTANGNVQIDTSQAPYGNAQIDTAQSKFGGSSVLFDGSGDYLTTPDHADFAFGTGDFTIDTYYYTTDKSLNQTIYGQYQDNNNRISWSTHDNDKILFQIYEAGVATIYFVVTWTHNNNTWYHLALVRNGDVFTIYADGVALGSTTVSLNYPDLTGTANIGCQFWNGSPLYYHNGWLDEVRVSKGIARWTSNFTPPQAPYDYNSDFVVITTNTKLQPAVLGEPCIGKAQSPSYILNAGLLPTIQSNPPILTQDIPYQSWAINSSKSSAFDLDDYFTSPEGYSLTYTVSGNSKINVSIDPSTHIVSFSQTAGWFGTEKVYFTCADTENNTIQSNEVALQVANAVGQPNKPVIVDTQLTPATLQEGDLVTLTVKALDLDNQDLTFNYSDFFTETRRWKDGSFCYSEAAWQTGAQSKGHYNIGVTAADPTSLADTENVLVNIGNFNHAPVLDPIADITANEGDLVTIAPHATDSDNDAITYYFSSPFDTQGKWLTSYDDAGLQTIQVIASDGIDTVSQNVKITINNTNRAPEITLTLNKYTVKPNELFNISLSASDPDVDSMTFSLKKDGIEIASGPITNTYNTTTSFPALGDHNISATVTDSSGRSTTDSKGVDVADPNANRDAINPVMGDFNGDALSDLGLHNSDTGTWEICISDKGVFRNAADWLTGFGTSRDFWPIGGDFNGDSKTDIGIYNNTTGELKVALSTGSGFGVQGTWLSFPSASYAWQAITGNFNGDKYTDFALYNKDTGEVKVALGTGSGFGAFTTWSTGLGAEYAAMSGDFNGDSLTDLCLFKKSTGECKVAFSNTQAFVDGSSWISGYALNQDVSISDFNNDGLTDIGYWDKTSFKWYYAAASGASFIDKGTWLESFGTGLDESASTGDFDGNGLTDAATFDRDQIGINRWATQLSSNKPADLLNEVDNGIGGKTQVTYTYAAAASNSQLPFPVYVASTISSINTLPVDRAATYTQNFIFSGGYFDAVEREFRGFAKVKVTDPITNNYSETYFYQGSPGQDGALKGQIEKVISFDGNARKISETYNTYEIRKAGPETRVLGFPALAKQTTTVYEENATYITTEDKLTYDNIGNPLEAISEGDTAKTGDEKSTATTYAQAYEAGFNRPLESFLKDKDRNVVSKKTFEYDTKGNLIKDNVFIFNPLTTDYRLLTTDYAYDSFGNLTSTTNAQGSIVITDYETTFYAYPERITNSLGHTVQYTYDPKFGAVTSVTDTNGLTTTTEYDSLGRVTANRYPLYANPVVTYSYPDFNTKVTTNALNFSKTEYVDGLGRKYRVVSQGEDGLNARNVSSEVYFNNRGLTERESLPHYIDEDPAQVSYVRYEYDIRGRIKKTISDFPGAAKDAEGLVNYINPLYTETTDPQGNRKGARKDVYGNVLEITEFTSDGVYHTYYEYDIQSNLTKTTDNQGNITQIFYDSIGRKLKMIDPDMGIWTYEYDLLGNLIKQTDAKGQVLEFTYDAINRLTRKVSLRVPEGGEAISVDYTYDDSSKPYCLGRLSKITDSSGSTEFFYDALGREIKSIKTVPDISGMPGTVPYAVERTYDILDRLTKLTYPDGEVLNYTYDTNSGLLESLRGTKGAEAISYVQDTTYNAKGQIKAIKYGNNTQTDYTYGQDLRLSHILTSLRAVGGGEAISYYQDLNYIFDKNGNVTTLTDNLRSNIRTYNYDSLDRLTQASNVPAPGGGYTNFNYQYDSIGNMTYKSDLGVMTYGLNAGPHALTSAGGFTYQYDADGNMTVGKNKTLEYDAENRLIRVTDSGLSTTDYLYDGDGGRVRKSVIANPPQAGEAISTTYIGSLYEVTTNSEPSTTKYTKHIFAGSQRVCLVATDSGLSTTDYHYYHSDHLGSSNVITDSSGHQVQSYEYTPYGGLATDYQLRTTDYLFTGKELDSTGLYFYGARYYDPTIGRFITADTIVQSPYDPQSLNRYSYCRNNPINYIDPTGHWSWKKFWNSFAGAFLGAVVTVLTAGAGAPLWLAGMAGGMMGGALTGGLEGGARGALFGGLIGGALGAFGGWGVDKFGWQFGVGMLAAGAGVAGATNSWDSFVGGFTGGIAGAAVGNGIDSYFNDPLSIQDPDRGVINPTVEGRGVGTTPEKALQVANETGSRVVYTQSRGIAADIVRGGMQMVFKNSLASRQFAQYWLGHPGTTYNLHSEMTLTALGAAKMLQGKAIGGRFNLVSPFYSKTTAESTFSGIGATVHWEPPHIADSAGAFATNPVVAPVYGVLGVVTLEHFHGYQTYQNNN